MTTAIHKRVELCRNGEDPTFVARTRSGWIVLGEFQFLRGHCMLLPDPVVSHLNDFHGEARQAFLNDMALLGDALLAVTGGIRINYAMFGNMEPALHAHLFPRYSTEPEAMRAQTPWAYDWRAYPSLSSEETHELICDIRKAAKGFIC